MPWRLLAYLLKFSPEVDGIRTVIRKRLLDEARVKAQEKQLDARLLTLHRAGFVTLEPSPPPPPAEPQPSDSAAPPAKTEVTPEYKAVLAHPTPELDRLLVFRAIHPLYGAFLLDHLGIADRDERIQALESVLEMPRPLLRYVRVPWPDQLPPGPLATQRLDPELIQRGLIVAPVEVPEDEEEADDDRSWRERPPGLADKLRLLFDAIYPEVTDVLTTPVWCAGELLRFGGNFNLYVRSRDLIKQEGIIFRHLLRLILLLEEFQQVCPKDTTLEEWQADLRDLAERLTTCCRAVDPTSTDQMIQQAHAEEAVDFAE